MADQVQVDLVAQDAQFIASTEKAAASVAALAAQEEKLGKVAQEKGVDQKKFSQQFAKVEADQVKEKSKAAKEVEKQEKKAAAEKAKTEKKAASDATKSEKEREAKTRQLARVLLGRKAVILGEASGLGTAAVAGAEMGTALVAAGVAAGVLLVEVGKIAIEAARAKDDAKGMLDVLTAGKGDKTLELVDQLAGQLGIKFEDARDKFIQFRRAGLDNKQSAQLLKLSADLDTVDRSGKLSAEAVEKTLKFAGPHQTAIQAQAAAREMALLAKQANVSGEGIQSAAESATGLQGAINKIDNTKTAVLEKIGAKIGPSVDSAAQAFAGLVEKFVESKSGQKAIEGLSDGIIAFARAIDDASTIAEKALNDPVVQAGIELMGDGFREVGKDVGALAAAIILLPTAASQGLAALGKFIYDTEQTGEHMVDGLIEGIKNGAERLYKSVTDLATGAKDAFKKTLGIHSPSRVFEGYGVNIGIGAERGIDRSFPSGEDIAARVAPPRGVQSVFAAQPSPIFGGASQRQQAPANQPIQITIEHLGVPRGEDAGPWMRAAGRELGLGVQAILLGQGAPQ